MYPGMIRDCPFCGGTAEIDTRQGYRSLEGEIGSAIAVYCVKCSAQISICREDVPEIYPEWVIALWNRWVDQSACTD